MKILISLSVDYDDIGARKPIKGRRLLKRRRRNLRPRKPSRPPKTREERLSREVRNLRSQVKKRLDMITLRKGTIEERRAARQEVRKIFAEYKRAAKRLEQSKK